MTKLLAIATLLFTVNTHLSNLSEVEVNPLLVGPDTVQTCNGTALIDFAGTHTYYCSINGVIRWAVAYDMTDKQLVVANTATDRLWKFPVPYGSAEHVHSSNKYNGVSFTLTPGPARNGWLPISFVGKE